MVDPSSPRRPGPTLEVLLRGWLREAERRREAGEDLPGEMTPEEIEALLASYEASSGRTSDEAALRFVRSDLLPALQGGKASVAASLQASFTKLMLLGLVAALLLAALLGGFSWEATGLTALMYLGFVLAGNVAIRLLRG